MELAIELVDGEFGKLDIAKAMDGEVIEVNVKAKLISMHVTSGAIQKFIDKAEAFDSLVESGLIDKELLERIGYLSGE